MPPSILAWPENTQSLKIHAHGRLDSPLPLTVHVVYGCPQRQKIRKVKLLALFLIYYNESNLK